jgi:hypothetical protein
MSAFKCNESISLARSIPSRRRLATFPAELLKPVLSTPSRNKNSRGIVLAGRGLGFLCLKELSFPEVAVCGNAEGEHPIPVICFGQAPVSAERPLDAVGNGTATNYFSQSTGSLKGQLVRRQQPGVFHSLFPGSHLRCFPLGFHVGKIGARRNSRIVTIHSLHAKITWLKHCRNLGHGKLTAARGQL